MIQFYLRLVDDEIKPQVRWFKFTNINLLAYRMIIVRLIRIELTVNLLHGNIRLVQNMIEGYELIRTNGFLLWYPKIKWIKTQEFVSFPCKDDNDKIVWIKFKMVGENNGLN